MPALPRNRIPPIVRSTGQISTRAQVEIDSNRSLQCSKKRERLLDLTRIPSLIAKAKVRPFL